MSIEPENKKNDSENRQAELADGLIPDQIEIEVDDPMLTGEFDETDFDHEFDDDFEEEIEGEYELEDDQYGEDFDKEFGHLTKDEDDDSEEE